MSTPRAVSSGPIALHNPMGDNGSMNAGVRWIIGNVLQASNCTSISSGFLGSDCWPTTRRICTVPGDESLPLECLLKFPFSYLWLNPAWLKCRALSSFGMTQLADLLLKGLTEVAAGTKSNSLSNIVIHKTDAAGSCFLLSLFCRSSTLSLWCLASTSRHNCTRSQICPQDLCSGLLLSNR